MPETTVLHSDHQIIAFLSEMVGMPPDSFNPITSIADAMSAAEVAVREDPFLELSISIEANHSPECTILSSREGPTVLVAREYGDTPAQAVSCAIYALLNGLKPYSLEEERDTRSRKARS